MSQPDDPTTARLIVLRAAVDALGGLGDDAPDQARILALLRALDPALSGDACGSAAWVSSTGLPAPAWVREAHELRRAIITGTEDVELPDEGLMHAMAMDPELGQRLMAERAFHRFLRRHPLFPAPEAEVVNTAKGPWWTRDALRSDGAWVRLRVAGVDAPPVTDPVEVEVEALAAATGRAVRRTVVGPCYGHEEGPVRGLYARVEASGEPTARRLVVDRMVAEDVAEPDVVVVPFAVPDAH